MEHLVGEAADEVHSITSFVRAALELGAALGLGAATTPDLWRLRAEGVAMIPARLRLQAQGVEMIPARRRLRAQGAATIPAPRRIRPEPSHALITAAAQFTISPI